jgi:hypothetical protein
MYKNEEIMLPNRPYISKPYKCFSKLTITSQLVLSVYFSSVHSLYTH